MSNFTDAFQDTARAASKKSKFATPSVGNPDRESIGLDGINDYTLLTESDHPHLGGLCQKLKIDIEEFSPHQRAAEGVLRQLRSELKPYAATANLMRCVMAWPDLSPWHTALCLDMIDARRAQAAFGEFFSDDVIFTEAPKIDSVADSIKAVTMTNLSTSWEKAHDRPFLECLSLEQMERIVGVVGASSFPWRLHLNGTVVFAKCAVNAAILIKLELDSRLARAKAAVRRLSRPDGDSAPH